MRFLKTPLNFLSAACVIAMAFAATVVGQSTISVKTPSASAEISTDLLNLQATSPLPGEPDNKCRAIDSNGTRMYVCCPYCIDTLKKNPGPDIKKHEGDGQSDETIDKSAPKKSSGVKADRSMENMKPIDMISPGDTMIKNSQTGYWTCSTHPDIHQSASGNCPVCGRNLVFRKSDKYTTRMSSMDNGNMK